MEQQKERKPYSATKIKIQNWSECSKRSPDYIEACKKLDEAIFSNRKLFDDSPEPDDDSQAKWQSLGFISAIAYQDYLWLNNCSIENYKEFAPGFEEQVLG